MSDFEKDDNRAEWLRLLDEEAEKLAAGGKIAPREVEELREEGWFAGRREVEK